MAEVIGIVSSGIAIAQLAGSVGAVAIKLSGLWQEVKDVPETIQYIMNHLSILGTIVNEMETIGNNNSLHDSAAGQPHRPSPSPLAIQQCQMACKDLENLVRDLSVDIESSRKRKRLMGKVAVVLKKDTLANYEMRLQSSVQLLSLAHQVYTTSLIMRQPEFIMASVTKALALTSSSPTLVNANTHTLEIEEGKPPEHNQQVVGKSKKLSSDYDTGVKRARYRTNYERNFLGLLRYTYSEWEDQVIAESTAQEYRFLLRLPNWLLSKAWEFHVSAASSGWRTHLKQYVVVSKSSPVYEYAEAGNIVELKKLFSQGLATPFSLTEQGSTLLHIVADGRRNRKVVNLEGIEWLIKLGVDPTMLNDHGEKYTSHFFYYILVSTPGPRTRRPHLTATQREEAYHHLVSRGELPNDLHKVLAKLDSPSNCLSDIVQDEENRAGVYDHLIVILEVPEIFDIYVRVYAPELPTWKLSRRLSVFTAAINLVTIHPKVLRRLLWGDHSLSAGDLLTTAVRWKPPGEITVWSFLASVWTVAAHYYLPGKGWAKNQVRWTENKVRWTENKVRWSSYRDLVRDLASICDPEHISWRSSQSQISALFWVILETNCCILLDQVQRIQRQHFQRMTRYWLKDLQSGGIDLKSYGKMETKTFKQFRQGKIQEWYQNQGVGLFRDVGQDRHAHTVLFLTGFTYGPQPEDWVFFWDPFVEDFVEDFWRLIEDPPLAIPGSWVD